MLTKINYFYMQHLSAIILAILNEKLKPVISTVNLNKCWRYWKVKEIMYDK